MKKVKFEDWAELWLEYALKDRVKQSVKAFGHINKTGTISPVLYYYVFDYYLHF